MVPLILHDCFIGLVPVPVRPPNFQNVRTTLPTVKMIVEVSKAMAIMTTVPLIKLLRSKEAQTVVEARQWPPVIPTEDLPKKKLSPSYRPANPEMVAYLDFSVSTTGMLAGVKVIYHDFFLCVLCTNYLRSSYSKYPRI